MSPRILVFLLLPFILLTHPIANAGPEGESKHLNRIGDLRFDGGSDYQLTRGNFDKDATEEFILSMMGDNGVPAVLIYDHRMPNHFDRTGDLRFEGAIRVRVTAGNVFGDARDELSVAVMRKSGRHSLEVYEVPHGNTPRQILKLNFEGGSDLQVTTGNFDGDALNEVVLTMLGANGELASIVYDLEGVEQARRIGDHRISDGRWIRAVAANLDADSMDELVLVYDQPNNQRKFATLDHPVNGRHNLISHIDFIGGSDFQLAAANLDWDVRDEVILGMNGADGRLAVLVYDTNGGAILKREGDLRFPGGTDLNIATANIDHDPAAEILLSLMDGNGRSTLLAYDALTSRHLRRLEVLRMMGGTHPGVAAANLTGNKVDEIFFTMLGADGRRAVLAYDYRADMSEARGDIPLLTILWDPHRPDHPAPSRNDIKQILFENPTFNVAGWFRENSDGVLDLTNAGIFGWIDAQEDWEFYWRQGDYAPPTDLDDPHYCSYNGKLWYADDNGFLGGHAAGWAEAIRNVDQSIDFSAFDQNADGIIQPQELAILVIKPQNKPSGYMRGLLGRQVRKNSQSMLVYDPEPLRVDNVELTFVSEVYIGGNVNRHDRLGLFVEELAHAFLGIPDQYFEGQLFDRITNYSIWNDPGGFSLTVGNDIHAHLEPFQKWRLGWTDPKPIDRDGRYQIRHAAGYSDTLILKHPQRGSREYFLLENRWADPTSYELNLRDQGLAVWHVIEDPQIYGKLESPRGIRPGRWEKISSNDWGRRGIRLLRPEKRIPFSAEILSVDIDGDNLKEALLMPHEWEIRDPFLFYDFQVDEKRLDRMEQPRFIGGRDLTATVAQLDHDSAEEAVFALEGTDGRLAVLAYDGSGTTPARMNRIGDRRLPGARKPAIIAANIDSDPTDEIMLVRVSSNAHVLLSIYESPSHGEMDIIQEIDLGKGSEPFIAVGDLDGDSDVELTVGWLDPSNRWQVSLFQQASSKLKSIAKLSLLGGSNMQAHIGDLDGVAGDELVLSLTGTDGRLAVIPHGYRPEKGLFRVGDLRFPDRTNLELAICNIDADPSRELVLSTLSADGTLRFHFYDLLQPNDFRLLGELDFSGGFDASIACADLDARSSNELMVSFRGSDERLTMLVYDLTDLSKLKNSRIGDARYGRDMTLSLWDGSDQSTGYDLVSDNPDPDRTSLRWTDGTPSGFAIRNISAAGPVMTIDINVPD